MDLWGIVRNVQRTCGSSSTHFPFASSNLFLSPLTMTLLTTSACPFHCGYAEVEYLFVIPRSQQYFLKALLSNYSLLSEMSVWGIPNRVTIFFQTNFLAFASLIFTMVIVCEATSVVLIVWMDIIVYSKGVKGSRSWFLWCAWGTGVRVSREGLSNTFMSLILV